MELADNCAVYVNCTAYMSGGVSDPIQECSYPQLFDTTTMMCADFKTVSCDHRSEPQAPCMNYFYLNLYYLIFSLLYSLKYFELYKSN